MFQTPRRRIGSGTAQAPGDRRWAQDPSWRATGISAAEAFPEAASSISDSDGTGHGTKDVPGCLRKGSNMYVASRVEQCSNNEGCRLFQGISGIPDERRRE